MTIDSIYRGYVSGDGTQTVCIDEVVLELGPSLALRRHSPDGFSWGYSGSGPAQLALGILLDATKSSWAALALYQEFKRQVIARLPQREPWTLTRSGVVSWVLDQVETPRYKQAREEQRAQAEFDAQTADEEEDCP